MGTITLVYTLLGGLMAVVWSDVIQLAVYVTGGIAALLIAWHLAGGADQALAAAAAAGKLRILNPVISFTQTYTLLGGLIGGALLSAASHGTDQLIVQRLLATRSLRDARIAVVGSGVAVILQFGLFLLIGSAIWAAGLAPDGMPADQIFSRFILDKLPAGLAGLMVAGILAAAMSTISSSINALASSVTHDLYSSWTGVKDPVRLLRLGKIFSAGWGIALIGAALFFDQLSRGGDTPVVVLALSIASITYGALLGTYVLAARVSGSRGRDVVGAVLLSVTVMLLVVFSAQLSVLPGFTWLSPVGRLAWPWYVPIGTTLTILAGWLLSTLPHTESTR
jgi:Na+/proline symporter